MRKILCSMCLIAVLALSACSGTATEGTVSTTTTVATTVATTTTAPIETTTEAEPTETEPVATTEAEPVETEPVETDAITTEAIEETEPVETTEPIEETTKPVETTAKPEWVETEYSATLYTNTACNAREKAIQGTAVVKTYVINTKVTIVAKTDTGYYKLADGTFIHGDYLSKSKTEETKPAQTTAKPASTTSKPEETTKPASSGTTSYDNAVDVVGMENYIPGYIYSEDWEAFYSGGCRNDGVSESGGIRIYKENFVVGKDIPAGWYVAHILSSGENGGTGILVSVKTSAGVEKFSLWYGFNAPDSQVMTPFYCADGDIVTGTCCIVPFIRNGYITSYEVNGNKHQYFLVGEGNELEAGTYKLEEDASTCKLKPNHIAYGAYIVRNGEFLYIHQVQGKWVDATSDTITVQNGDYVRLENMKIDY